MVERGRFTAAAEVRRRAPSGGLWGAGRDPAVQPRLVTAGGVPMDDALVGHLVDERNRVFQRRFRGLHVLALDGGADAPEGTSQVGAELAVAVAVLETL